MAEQVFRIELADEVSSNLNRGIKKVVKGISRFDQIMTKTERHLKRMESLKLDLVIQNINKTTVAVNKLFQIVSKSSNDFKAIGKLATSLGSIKTYIVNFFTILSNSLSSGLIGKNVIGTLISGVFGNILGSASRKSTKTNSGMNFSGQAPGGVYNSPHLAMFAEDGREAIIPLDKHRKRAIGLWIETGKRLGVKGYSEGTVGGGSSSSSNNSFLGGFFNDLDSPSKKFSQASKFLSIFDGKKSIGRNLGREALSRLFGKAVPKGGDSDKENSAYEVKQLAAQIAGGLIGEGTAGYIEGKWKNRKNVGREVLRKLNKPWNIVVKGYNWVSDVASKGYNLTKGGAVKGYNMSKDVVGNGYNRIKKVKGYNWVKDGIVKGYNMSKDGAVKGYNWTKGGIDKGYNWIKGSVGNIKKFSRSSKILKGFGKVAKPLSIGMNIASVATAKDNKERGEAIGDIVGTALFGFLGSFIPGMTIPAAMVGGFLGKKVGGFMGGNWENIKTSIKDKATSGLNWTKNGITKGLSWGKEAISKSPGSIIGSALGSVLGPFGAAAGGFLGNKAQEKFSKVDWKNVKNNTSSFIKDKVDTGKGCIKNLFGGMEKHATGGIFSTPHIAMFAEDGREAIIPLDKYRGRALKLWEETGKQLGVKQYAQGGIAGSAYAGATSNQSISISVNMADAFRGAIISKEVDEDEIGYKIAKAIQNVLGNMAG